MNKAEKQKLGVLIVTVVFLGLSLVSNHSRTPAGAAAQQRSAPGGSAVHDPLPLSAVLNQGTREPIEIKRNLFEFEGESGNESPEPSQTAPSIPDFPLAGEEKVQIPNVRYLGYYQEKEEGGQRKAAISNGGKIWVGQVGDVLGGKYEILQIEIKFVVLRIVADSNILRLPLGNKEGEFVEKEP